MIPTRDRRGERTGTEIDVRPFSSSSTSSAQPWRRTRASSASQGLEVRHGLLGEGGEGVCVEPRGELGLVELREDELARRRGVQRNLRSDPVGHAHVAVGIELEQDLHARPAVGDGEQRRFAGQVPKPCEREPGRVDQPAVRVRPPGEPDELVTEHPAPPSERLLDEPGVGERPQRPRDRGAGKAGDAREFGGRRARGPVGDGMEETDGAGERPGSRRARIVAHYMNTLAHWMDT